MSPKSGDCSGLPFSLEGGIGKIPEQSMEMNGSTLLKFWNCDVPENISVFISESLDKRAEIFVSCLERRFVVFVGESKK